MVTRPRTVFLAGSTWATVPAVYSDTHTDPSGAAAMPTAGPRSGIVATTWFVAGSIRYSASAVKSPIQTAPAAKATEDGAVPTVIVATTFRRVGEIRDTVPAPEFALQREPAPEARPVGCDPTSTVAR